MVHVPVGKEIRLNMMKNGPSLEYLTIQRLWESLFCHAFPHGTLLDCFDASNGFKPRFRQRNREGLAKHVVERASQSHQLHREDVLNLSL